MMLPEALRKRRVGILEWAWDVENADAPESIRMVTRCLRGQGENHKEQYDVSCERGHRAYVPGDCLICTMQAQYNAGGNAYYDTYNAPSEYAPIITETPSNEPEPQDFGF